jgi:hypothetical protein
MQTRRNLHEYSKVGIPGGLLVKLIQKIKLAADAWEPILIPYSNTNRKVLWGDI